MTFPSDAVAVIEEFTGANSTTPPNANWTNILNEVQIQSNQATGVAASSTNHCLWDTGTFGPNIDVHITVKTVSSNTIYLFSRMTTLVAGTTDGYYLMVNQATNTWQLYEVLNGVGTAIGSSAVQAISADDKIGLRIRGSLIEGYHYTGGAWNQTPIVTTTDATYAAAGYVGFGCYGSTIRLDDFAAATVAYSSSRSGEILAAGSSARIINVLRTKTGEI